MNLMERMEKKNNPGKKENKSLEITPEKKQDNRDNDLLRSEQQNTKNNKEEYVNIIEETHREIATMLSKMDHVNPGDVESLIMNICQKIMQK